MRGPFEVHLGVCTIWIYPQHYLVTTFPEGGLKLRVAPSDDADTVCRAYDLGYGYDIWALTLDHELAMTWLAQRAGLAFSRTLHHNAGLEEMSAADAEVEEDLVLAYLLTLPKHEIRPWFKKVLDTAA